MLLPPTLTAWLALLAFPIVVVVLFQRYPRPKAALFSFFGGLMFLPEHSIFKLPSLPPLDKHAQTNVLLLIMLLSKGGRARAEPWVRPLVVLMVISAFGTYFTNRDTQYFGAVEVGGLSLRDAVYVLTTELSGGMAALYLGMRFFRDESDLSLWVKTMATAGLLYSLLLVVEMRASPQLHNWIYRYHPHEDFAQSVRWGGYRPVGFMAHGLATSLFMLGTNLASVVWARQKAGKLWRLSASRAAWVLSIVTLMCKSTAVWVYMVFALPMVRWGKPKALGRLALVLALVTCSYPLLRATGNFPVEALVGYASQAGEDRAGSIRFRFDNEDMLIKHTQERMAFGWSWNHGRNQVHTPWGSVMTVTDGGWIIAFSAGGAVGLSVYLGMVVLCIITVCRRLSRVRDTGQRYMLASLVLYVAIMWIDILPNGSFNLLPHFLGGALCSISRRLILKPRKPKKKVVAPEAAVDSAPLVSVAVAPPAR